MEIGHEKRNYKMPLREQIESIAEDYEGFEYLYTYCGIITFMYDIEKGAD